MAATKPDKIREEMYDFIVQAMRLINQEPVGRHKNGLVYKNHLDGEHIIVKVIKKRDEVPAAELTPITTYAEKIKMYKSNKK